jgi:hypothetical protein
MWKKKNLDYTRKIMGMQLKSKENPFFKISKLVLIRGKHTIRISNPDCSLGCFIENIGTRPFIRYPLPISFH